MEKMTRNTYTVETEILKDRVQALVARFLVDDRMDFLKQNALLLDGYFQRRLKTAGWGREWTSSATRMP